MTTLVIGDLHLRSAGDPRPAEAVARLLEVERDASLVFAGDALDLPAEATADPIDAIRRAVAHAPSFSRAILDRAARGLRTTFVAGNHDAALATDAGLEAFHDALGLAPEHRSLVVAEPWLVRLADGKVHVEHGHVFEPDGAPPHPLAPIKRDDVGIALLRRFIVPIHAHELVHRNMEAPIFLLARVVLRFGALAPWIVARYVSAASRIVFESGKRFPLEQDRAEGTRRLRSFAARSGLDAETLDLLIASHATPTLARSTATFLRLYLDRVGATFAVLGGSSVGAISRVTTGAWASTPVGMGGLTVAALGALSLVASIVAGGNRYHGRAERALAEGAERTAEITGAKTVVLGHVHVDASGPRYRNTASFAFPRGSEGRPYLRVEDDGEVARAFA